MTNRTIKTKSLSLSRGTQTPKKTEDLRKPIIPSDDQLDISTSLDSALNSPIARPSRLSSTPIRNSAERCEESPDQDYRGSPTSLYPCTQESGAEITWDWDGRAGSKRDDSGSGSSTSRHNGALNHTPKRPHLLQKKRLAKSNSPLLNIPPKRKLVDLEVAEKIGKFAAELEALATEIKTGKSLRDEEKRKPVPTTSSNTANIFEMPTQKVYDIHEVDTLEFEDKNESDRPQSSLDDMFDDFDEAMVQCSQEVEKKLESEAQKKTGSRPNPTIRIDQKKEKADASSSREQIPDDSFDDCLAFCSDDDELIGKFLDDKNRKKPGVSDKTNSWQASSSSDASSNLRQKQQSTSSSSFDANSNLRQKQQSTSSSSFDANSNLRQKQQSTSSSSFDANSNLRQKQQSMSSIASQNRKFFKEKSLSDSVCGKTGKQNISGTYNKQPAPMAKATSVYNMTSQASYSMAAAACRNNQGNHYNGGQQPQVNSKASWSYIKNTSNVALPRCTPAEIEKKRLEAKMKLEANRKKKFNLSLSGRS